MSAMRILAVGVWGLCLLTLSACGPLRAQPYHEPAATKAAPAAKTPNTAP
jgi:hypothetical protein